jgi:hypothetical protein
MARIVAFFPRQTLVGNAASAGVHYSEVFEVASTEELTASFRVAALTTSVTGVLTAQVSESWDSGAPDAEWAALGSLPVTGIGTTKATYSGLKRYVRGSVSVPSGIAATVRFEGIARESST